MIAQVRYSVAGRSRGRVAPCAVCTVHMETVFTGLASKPLRRFSPVWPQNHSDGFCWFGIKTGGDSFYRFGIKTCCDSFLQFGLKTGGDGFSWFGLKTGGGFLG
jgi:hypothetical protein